MNARKSSVVILFVLFLFTLSAGSNANSAEPWTANFTSPVGQIIALAVYNDKLFAGGSTVQSDAHLFAYDGNTWSDLNFTPGSDVAVNLIQALQVYNNRLYIGARVSIGYTCYTRVYIYDGSTFVQDFSTDGHCYCSGIEDLAIHDNILYAANGACGKGDVFQHLGDNNWVSVGGSDTPDWDAARALASYKGDLYAGTGLNQAEIKRNIRVGNVASFANTPIAFNGKYISGHSLDNRASVAALTVCLEEIRNYQLQWDLWCVATVQEEGHAVGAHTSTFNLMPQIGIAVDVTFAQEPGLNTHETFPLGKGVTLGIGANVHPSLHQKFKQLAEEIDMPYALETMPRSSGTDAMVMQITAAGIPTFVLGIPIRYMHTPVELTSLKDIRRAGRLLARFITSLKPDSLQSLFSGGAA